MPSIKVEKSSNLSPQECYQRVTQLLDTDKELRKLDPKYQCQFDAKSLSGQANGGQFKAQMKVVQATSGSHVEISVDLPFHLALVKGLVQKTLQKKLDEALT